LFVVFTGGWFGYEMAGFVFGGNSFSMHWYGTSLLAGSMWFMSFFSTNGVSFALWGFIIEQQRFLILVEWSILVARVCTEFFVNLVGLISGSNIRI
jgi:hypothetical protein